MVRMKSGAMSPRLFAIGDRWSPSPNRGDARSELRVRFVSSMNLTEAIQKSASQAATQNIATPMASLVSVPNVFPTATD